MDKASAARLSAAVLLGKLREFRDSLLTAIRPGVQRKNAREIAARHKTDQIVTLLKAEDWAGLRRHFAAPVRWLLAPTLLNKGFTAVRLWTGALESTGSPVVSPGIWLTSIKIPVPFQRAKLAMALTMKPSGSLIGLNFIPQQLCWV